MSYDWKAATLPTSVYNKLVNRFAEKLVETGVRHGDVVSSVFFDLRSKLCTEMLRAYAGQHTDNEIRNRAYDIAAVARNKVIERCSGRVVNGDSLSQSP